MAVRPTQFSFVQILVFMDAFCFLAVASKEIGPACLVSIILPAPQSHDARVFATPVVRLLVRTLGRTAGI